MASYLYDICIRADDAAEEVGAGIVDPASQNCEAIRKYMEEM